MSAPLVELSHLSKAFGPTQALRDVSLSLQAGELRVLAGENGAGKSTLIRILSGALDSYEGTLRLGGHEVRFSSPGAATRAGVSTIHQELSLVGSMSVTDNLFLSGEGSPVGWLSHRRRRELARKRLSDLDLALDPEALVETLPLAQRQALEIARALTRTVRLLILDEPTSALNEAEAEKLFARLLELKQQGVAILYITHRMDEIYRLADSISVLRDGELVGTRSRAELPEAELVRWMVGRDVQQQSRASVTQDEVALEVAEAGARFAVHRGEVVGLAGLQGSGARELLLRLYAPPRRALKGGVGFISGDRDSAVLRDMSVQENASLASLRRWSRGGWVLRRREQAAVNAWVSRLRIKTPSTRAPLATLSGGNQQKVVLSRSLLAEPRVLLLDDPTRGVDVGAKADVYALITELAENGVGLLLASSDLEELLSLSDRLVVLYRGKAVATLSERPFDREQVLRLAMGGQA